MKHFRLFLLFFGVAVLASGAHAVPLEGDWIGEMNINGESQPIRAHFRKEEAGLKGTLDLPSMRLTAVPLRALKVAPPRVAFEAPVGEPGYVFEGKINGGVIKGTVTRSGSQGQFVLIRRIEGQRHARSNSSTIAH